LAALIALAARRCGPATGQQAQHRPKPARLREQLHA